MLFRELERNSGCEVSAGKLVAAGRSDNSNSSLRSCISGEGLVPRAFSKTVPTKLLMFLVTVHKMRFFKD